MNHELRLKRIICYIFIIFLASAIPTFAQSPYVLPYPSTMPGGVSYKMHLVWEKIMQYWYFGDLGQFTYNLNESDKYLVEAKTLFEYQQYLLGYQALKKSDVYFSKASPNLIAAKKHGKNTVQLQEKLKEAAQKHVEILTKLQQEIPQTFTWQPEKSKATELPLSEAIKSSINLRKTYE